MMTALRIIAVLAIFMAMASCVTAQKTTPNPVPDPALTTHEQIQLWKEQQMAQAALEQAQHQARIFDAVLVAGLLCAGIGVLLIFVGWLFIPAPWKSKAAMVGIGLLLAGGCVAGVCQAMPHYAETIAFYSLIAVGIVIFGAIAFGLWAGLVYARSFGAVVKFNEEAKQELTPEQRERLYGDGGLASKVLPPVAQKAVAKIRGKIKEDKT